MEGGSGSPVQHGFQAGKNDCRPEKEVPEVPTTEESLHVCDNTADILAGLQPEVEQGSEGTGLWGGGALRRLQRPQPP